MIDKHNNNNILLEKNSSVKLIEQKPIHCLSNNNTISVDNIKYSTLYNSMNNNTINNNRSIENLDNKENICLNNKFERGINNESNYYLYNKQNKKNKKNYLNNYNCIRVEKRQINYSLSHNNLYHFPHINNNNNMKWNDKMRNIFRKDSYCFSIEQKRKALGLDITPNFERELSIQTEKIIKKKKISLGKMKKKNIDNNNYLKSMNKNNNLFDEKQLIKVRKRDEYKNIERRFKYLKKIIENNNSSLVKNYTLTNFNHSKKNYDFKKRNDNTHKYDINNMENNDGKTNKTIDN